ncbi:MAG TPA: N(4)-(beta-N-acetylglucosaminyl)-L-asparaginase [Thermoanaerobaculia bacterium]|nr:N(4)-(beta-N-acetylglucosaminyl)-L-asparaginase [Thermoanaerobaculia bacterium]
MSPTSRRDLIKGTVLLPLAAQARTPAPKAAGGARPVVIASANGLKAVAKAYSVLASGGDPLDAVISGVNIVEDDPEDVSVGYGGIPNEEGVVQLDASVMDGRTMKAGGVGALENIKNPSKVARLVMERTNRVFLVGPGALKFARAHGFQEENLLTERSRKIWLYWKEKLSGHDDWIEAGNEEEKDPDILWFIEKYGVSDFRPQGTINCNAVTKEGDIVGTTTTSGLFFKLPGRLGDSPVIGAGLYVDGEVGACGSTGWGEGNLRSCGSHTVVEFLRQGKPPEEAALKTLERISALARENHDARGRLKPGFNINFYVVNKKGEYAGAALWSGSYAKSGTYTPARFAVADASGARLLESAYLYKREKS